MANYDARWDFVRPNKNPAKPPESLRDILSSAGNSTFNVDELLSSEYGQRMIDQMEPYFLSEDPMAPEVIDYWKEKGLKKEMVLGGPDRWNYWTIFTPVSASLPENKDRKYPLVFGLHGGSAGEFDGEPIFLAESTGYAKKAAEEEFILALPEDHDAPAIMDLYYYLMEKNYPVDRSRVYLVGYSAGSDRSVRCALRHPELFAGILVGAGVPFNLIDDPYEADNAAKYKMPMIAVGCLKDKGNHTPFYSSNSITNSPDFIKRILCAEGKFKWINRFFMINHIPYLSLEENQAYAVNEGTPSEKRIGLKAQRVKTFEWAGVTHHCLSFTDAEGIDSVRYIFIEGMPHFEPVDMMDLAWPFLKRFSRNTETGELLCSQPRLETEL